MWKSWRRLVAAPAEAPGSRLIALSASAVVAVVAGNFAPPAPVWGVPLAVVAVLAGWRGLAGEGRRWGWWVTAGAGLGLAACAMAARTPAGLAGKSVPVRFAVTVRDGWVSGVRGWGNRVRVDRLEWQGRRLRRPREMQLFVTAPAGMALLPRAGAGLEGSGELVFDRTLPLAAGHLRVKTLLLVRPAGGGSRVDRIREAGVRALEAGAGTDVRRLRAAGLAAALVLQRMESLQEGEIASMRRSGLVHLLSVSGLHVGLVAVLTWALLNAAGVPPTARRWVVAVAVVAFALLAGGNAPVRRAATGTVAYLVARRFGRPLERLPAVWGIVAGLALLEPAALLQPGFELSAFVTLALVRWVEPLARALSVLPHRAAQAVAVAVVAQGASSPLVGGTFALLPLLGIAGSILAAPLELVLVGASLGSLGAAGLSSRLGGMALDAVAAGQWLLDRASAVGGVASVPFAPLAPSLALVLATVGLAALTRGRAAQPAALLLVAGTVAWVAAPGSPDWRYEVRVLGVGEGMALLVRNGDRAALVDAGRSPTEAWRELARVRVRRLDALVLTHPDADHTGGAALLLERMQVRRLAFPRALGDRPEIVPLRRAARLRGVEEIPLERGQAATLAGARWETLWPPGAMAGVDNDASLVGRVDLGGPRVVVVGDLEARGEAALLACGDRLDGEVLQLPHHGSRTSSTPAFLAAVRPLIALAATGVRPRFAYPDPGVARRVVGLPAVLVEQGGGAVWVGWDDAGRLTLGPGTPVRVSRGRKTGGG
ncbi:MAG: ComEC/Rec2 family competence protein [Thermoanaerobaculaceae bacterium]|nr:ComEC/Rec2 family competence protein [Thermoanaerobaculaceae bacterium]